MLYVESARDNAEQEIYFRRWKNTGSGAADRSENYLKADNIIIACCNHDTLRHLQEEGDGAFLSRIEDKGEIIQMESAVPETAEHIRQVAQYIKQEIANLDKDFENTWGEVLAGKAMQGSGGRSEQIYGRRLPVDYKLKAREFRGVPLRKSSKNFGVAVPTVK